MSKKDIFKTLIAQKQSEMPFVVIDRDVVLPIDADEIITIPGVRRCGKSTLMEIAINRILSKGVRKENILWIGDHTDLAAVSSVAGTDRADFMIRIIAADAAASDLFFSCTDGIGKADRLLIRQRKNVKSQSLSTLTSDSGQRRKTINQIIKGRREKSHKYLLLPKIIRRE